MKTKTLFVLFFAIVALGVTAVTVAANSNNNPHPVFSTAWYKAEIEEAVAGSSDPFGAAVARMDMIWAFEAPETLKYEWGPAVGPVLPLGSIFWGGWFDPSNLPTGMVPLYCEPTNWACVYEIVEDNFQVPDTTAGGRALAPLNVAVYLPIVQR